jgi:hypothetical protein
LLIRPFARFFGVFGSADQFDHFVQMVERDQQAFQDMGAFFRFAQLEIWCGVPPPRCGT